MSPFAQRTVHALFIGLSVLPVVTASAQSRSFGQGTAVGVTVQALGSDDGWAEIPAMELHVTSIAASGFALDFGIATLPTALASGVLVFAPTVAPAYVLPVGGGGLMLKAGFTGVVVATSDGGGVVTGLLVGATAFVRLSEGFGLRAEIVPRWYGFGEGMRLTTFGIGFTSLPKRTGR